MPGLAPLRIVEIVRGIYILQSDPNANVDHIFLNILIQVINISFIAMRIFATSELSFSTKVFFETLAWTCLFEDALLKMITITSKKNAIGDKICEIYHNGILKEGILLLYEGVKSFLRSVVMILIIPSMYIFSISHLETITKISEPILAEIVAWAIGGAALALFIAEAPRKIIDDRGWPPSTNRRIVELSLSSVISAFIMGSVAVALQRADSLLSLFKPIFRPLLLISLLITMGYIFKTAISQFADTIGIQPGQLAKIEGFTFTVISTVVFSAMTATALGVTSSVRESFLMIKHLFFMLPSLGFISASTGTALKTFFFGVPTWNEINNDLFCIKFYQSFI